MKTFEIIVLVAIVSSVVGGIAGAFISSGIPSKERLIRDFYETETAVHVSPHSLRAKMTKGISDFTLVDLRSSEEYEEGHIAGAVSIPAYYDRETPAYDDKERIISSFKELPENKSIIVYCYSMPCMTGRKVGKMLADDGMYVQHLGVGWNEWRYFWNLWNHEFEWNITDVENYVASGPLPGSPNVTVVKTGCSEGDLGC